MEHLPRTITGTSPSLNQALWIVPLVLASALQAVAREEKGSSFETRGATIYYEIIGSGAGTPLIVVNGGPGFDHAYLHASSAWASFAKNRRVVFYDQRGTGRSISSTNIKDQTFTLADQIDDLEALRVHPWGSTG